MLFVFWLTAYPHTMRWMEEYSFFSALPDFSVIFRCGCPPMR